MQGSPRVAWSPIHVEDLGPVYAAVVAADPAAVKGQAFNVCGDEAVDNGMVAAAVAKVRLLHKTLHNSAASAVSRPRRSLTLFWQVLGIDPAKIDWSSPLWAIANKRFEPPALLVVCLTRCSAVTNLPRSAFMDNSKAKRVLGFAPRYNNAAECARFAADAAPPS